MSLTEETQNQKKSTPPVPEEAVREVPQEEWEAVAEALLFSAGDSIALVHIAKTLGVDQQTAQQVVEGLAAKYDEQKRGIRIIRAGRAYQMTSRPEYYPYIGQMYKSEVASIRLTDTQLEILAIIAYRQPITKMEIEEIRGVRSDAVVNRLMEYGLIEEKGRLKAPGRPVQFGTTEEFLKFFGIEDLKQMPHLAEAMEDKQAEQAQLSLELADLTIVPDTEDEETE